jgi:hypothetical protein
MVFRIIGSPTWMDYIISKQCALTNDVIHPRHIHLISVSYEPGTQFGA